MKLLIQPVILSAVLLFSNMAFSATCPALSDIQAVGISQAQAILPQSFVGYRISQYNTGFNWMFVIGYFENVTPPQAITDANLLLNSMVAPGVLDTSESRIICHYDTGQNFTFATAIRDIFQISPLDIKQYFNKH